jgi:hypothetical protein
MSGRAFLNEPSLGGGRWESRVPGGRTFESSGERLRFEYAKVAHRKEWPFPDAHRGRIQGEEQLGASGLLTAPWQLAQSGPIEHLLYGGNHVRAAGTVRLQGLAPADPTGREEQHRARPGFAV